MIIDVLEGDVLEKNLDVLILKYADEHHGADSAVSRALGIPLKVSKGEHRFFPTLGKLKTKEILVLGVGPLALFDYRQIWEFAEKALLTIERERPAARRVGITIHGPGYGLDELASVDSVLSGLQAALLKRPSVDGLGSGDLRVFIVELNRRRANRLREYLAAGTPHREAATPMAVKAFGLPPLQRSLVAAHTQKDYLPRCLSRKNFSITSTML
jgi:hypothetical protein